MRRCWRACRSVRPRPRQRRHALTRGDPLALRRFGDRRPCARTSRSYPRRGLRANLRACEGASRLRPRPASWPRCSASPRHPSTTAQAALGRSPAAISPHRTGRLSRHVLHLRRARCALAHFGRQGHGLRRHAVGLGVRRRGPRPRRHGRPGLHDREGPRHAERGGLPAGGPLRRGSEPGSALRRDRGSPGRATRPRYRDRRPSPRAPSRVEVHRLRSGRPPLRARGRALQRLRVLRSALREHPPLPRGRHARGHDGAWSAEHRRVRLGAGERHALVHRQRPRPPRGRRPAGRAQPCAPIAGVTRLPACHAGTIVDPPSPRTATAGRSSRRPSRSVRTWPRSACASSGTMFPEE